MIITIVNNTSDQHSMSIYCLGSKQMLCTPKLFIIQHILQIGLSKFRKFVKQVYNLNCNSTAACIAT